ncbi:MAG: hypothetical protein BJ554DRAFT_1213, partial [Olpidium bornovanus]
MAKKKIDWDAIMEAVQSSDEEENDAKPVPVRAGAAGRPPPASAATPAAAPRTPPAPSKPLAAAAVDVANMWQTFGAREAARREAENALLPRDYPGGLAVNAPSKTANGVGLGNLHRQRGTSSFNPMDFNALVRRQNNPALGPKAKHKVHLGATTHRVKFGSGKVIHPPRSKASASSSKQNLSSGVTVGAPNPFAKRLATAHDLAMQLRSKGSSLSFSDEQPSTAAATAAAPTTAAKAPGAQYGASQPAGPVNAPSRPRLATANDLAGLQKAKSDAGKHIPYASAGRPGPKSSLHAPTQAEQQRQRQRKNGQAEAQRMSENAHLLKTLKKMQSLDLEFEHTKIKLAESLRSLSEARCEVDRLRQENQDIRAREEVLKRGIHECELREMAWREKELEWEDAIKRARASAVPADDLAAPVRPSEGEGLAANEPPRRVCAKQSLPVRGPAKDRPGAEAPARSTGSRRGSAEDRPEAEAPARSTGSW